MSCKCCKRVSPDKFELLTSKVHFISSCHISSCRRKRGKGIEKLPKKLMDWRLSPPSTLKSRPFFVKGFFIPFFLLAVALPCLGFVSCLLYPLPPSPSVRILDNLSFRLLNRNSLHSYTSTDKSQIFAFLFPFLHFFCCQMPWSIRGIVQFMSIFHTWHISTELVACLLIVAICLIKSFLCSNQSFCSCLAKE